MEKFIINEQSIYKTTCTQIKSNNSPSPRSLHSVSYLNDYLFIFGGFDGESRINDFYKYSIKESEWRKIITNDIPPTPRERHFSITHENSLFIFGGFDGSNRLNDFYEFNIENNTWQEVLYSGSGFSPSPRHSTSGVIHDGNLYILFGYDGICRNDIHKFNFETNTWSEIKKKGVSSWPKERYRTYATISNNYIYTYGGHDGIRQLDDLWRFDIKNYKWEEIKCNSKLNLPSFRDSHIMFSYKGSIFIHGGNIGGVSMSKSKKYHKNYELLEYNISLSKWGEVKIVNSQVEPSNFNIDKANLNNLNNNDNISSNSILNISDNLHHSRNINNQNSIIFCHGGVFVESEQKLFIFGGYDGTNRHNEFKSYEFSEDASILSFKNKSNQSKNLESFINNTKFSDVVLITENDEKIYSHKIILSRIPYFDSLFNSGMKETIENEITITFINSKIMLIILNYIYTGNISIKLDDALSIFEACNYLGLEDLNSLCEEKILSNLSVETCCFVLLKADEFNSDLIKEKCIKFIIDNFVDVSLSQSFKDLLDNKELALEVIKGYSYNEKHNKNSNKGSLNMNSSIYNNNNINRDRDINIERELR